MPKPIYFTEHAREVVGRRQIDEELVQQVVEQPGQCLAGEGHLVLQKKFFDSQLGKTMLLRVFVRETPEALQILTVYKTSRIEKYWKAEGETR